MRAFAVERLGSAAAILDLAKPTAAEVYVVRVTCADVNRIDYKLVDSLGPQSCYPFVIGIHFAGVLESLQSSANFAREIACSELLGHTARMPNTTPSPGSTSRARESRALDAP